MWIYFQFLELEFIHRPPPPKSYFHTSLPNPTLTKIHKFSHPKVAIKLVKTMLGSENLLKANSNSRSFYLKENCWPLSENSGNGGVPAWAPLHPSFPGRELSWGRDSCKDRSFGWLGSGWKAENPGSGSQGTPLALPSWGFGLTFSRAILGSERAMEKLEKILIQPWLPGDCLHVRGSLEGLKDRGWAWNLLDCWTSSQTHTPGTLSRSLTGSEFLSTSPD